MASTIMAVQDDSVPLTIFKGVLEGVLEGVLTSVVVVLTVDFAGFFFFSVFVAFNALDDCIVDLPCNRTALGLPGVLK